MYLKNCWYVAAWDHEVLADNLLQRTVLGHSLVFFRTEDGSVVAMDNRCCHRHAPLHLGRKEGDCIRCMYHGLKFDASGRCVEVPGQETIPPKLGQKVYPLVQKKRWIWIWMGDPAKVDSALIPDVFSLQHPQWRWKPSYQNFQCNYLLICDNLLDFSHLSFVHEKTFGGSSSVAEARATISQSERGIHVSRPVRNTTAAPYHQRLGKFSLNVNRWINYDFLVPGVLMLDAGVRPVDNAEDDDTGALRFHSCQAITPESATSTHYFFMQAHNFRLDDATVTEAIEQSQLRAFAEDRVMLEAQQKMIDLDPNAKMTPMAADAGLARYRLLLQRLIDAENKPA